MDRQVKNRLLSLPMLVLPAVLWFCCRTLLYTAGHPSISLLLVIIAAAACLFHLIWVIIMSFRRGMGGLLIMYSVVGKILLAPLYVTILAYAVGLLSSATVLDLLHLSEDDPNVMILLPIITGSVVLLIFGILSLGQMIGYAKLHAVKEINLFQFVVHIILTWCVPFDVIFGIGAYFIHGKAASLSDKI